MIKKYGKTILLVLIILVVIYCIKYLDFSGIISNCLDKERIEKYGSNFNVFYSPECNFEINHYDTGYKLEFVKNKSVTVLLNNVSKYKFIDENLYVINDYGCAFVTNNVGYLYLGDGNSNDTLVTNSEQIVIYDDFYDFTTEVQKEFKGMKNLRQDLNMFYEKFKVYFKYKQW